jgi:hypothetical protein
MAPSENEVFGLFWVLGREIGEVRGFLGYPAGEVVQGLGSGCRCLCKSSFHVLVTLCFHTPEKIILSGPLANRKSDLRQTFWADEDGDEHRLTAERIGLRHAHVKEIPFSMAKAFKLSSE